MRKLIVALTVAAIGLSTGLAQEKKEPAKKPPLKKAPEITLKIGDAAPPLKADQWLQGDEVKAFAAGKTYVVEFWATWCGPCIVMMPHLSELQAEFKSYGVTFIGYSAKDGNNSADKVAAFVKKRGPKLKYTFAFADDRDTYNAWMRAAGRNGIPCSFVVDKAGKIAYVGHPMYLDVVLPKIVDGSWKGQESMAELDSLEKEVQGVFRALGGDVDEALKTLSDFDTRHPALSKIPYFIGPKINLLLRAKKTREARALAEEVMARAVKQEDPTALRTVSTAMRAELAKEDKDCLAISLQAAEKLVAVAGDQDAMALFNLAETQFVTGDRAKAKENGQKAVEAADSAALKKQIEQRVKKFDDPPKEEKKAE